MEEDIKILKELTEEYNSQHYMDMPLINGKQIQALENLLKGYRELEENKKLKTIKGFEENIEVSKFGEWVGKNYIDYKFEYENYQRILADYIPKSKIKEKIEELEEEIDKLADEASKSILENNQGKFDLVNKSANNISMQIQALRELMEE